MNKSTVFKILLMSLCLTIGGPELGIGLEMLGLLNLMGVELFVFAFSLPILYYGSMAFYKVQEFDPYYFTSPRKDLAQCPALLAHAIPFFIVAMFVVINNAVISFFFGE